MQERFYPDTNVIQRMCGAWTPPEFDRRAAAADVVLTLGLHVIYELARGFLSPPHVATVKAAFEYLSQLDRVEYLPPVDDVVRAEFEEARRGVPIIAVLDPLNQSAVKLEIARLAHGQADQAAKFIAKREAGVRPAHARIARANTRKLAGLRGEKTFAEFRQRVAPTGRAVLSSLARFHRVRARWSRHRGM